MSVQAEVERVVDWYLDTVYGRWEGPGTTPFFADQRCVGHFAVSVTLLARGDSDGLFRLLIALAMFQSRRDVDIMAIQRAMAVTDVRAMTAQGSLRVLCDENPCEFVDDAAVFLSSCDVARVGARVVCSVRPRSRCHVKEATRAIGRMGDMGKLPTSAFLTLGEAGLAGLLRRVCDEEASPTARAELLVDRLTAIHRVGRKLASLYVSALSTPELTGVAPWHPLVDGGRLVVVDANVATAVKIWRGPRASKNYDATSTWVRQIADKIATTRGERRVRLSPRLVQQAIYVFRSQSNRTASGDACASRACASCPSRICPFRARGRKSRRD